MIDQDDNAAVIGIENSDDKKIDITIDENSVDIEANIFADDIDLVINQNGFFCLSRFCRGTMQFTMSLLFPREGLTMRLLSQ